jgi:hypothetical protein
MILNAKIAKDIHGWCTYLVTEWQGGVHGNNRKIPYWHEQDGTKVMSHDEYEPTEDTSQAFDLLVAWDLLGENLGFLMAAAIEVEEQKYALKDPHATSRLAICEAALACNFALMKTFEKHEELDYAY